MDRNNLGLVGTGIILAIVALVVAAIFPLVAVAATFAFHVGIALIVIGAILWLVALLRSIL